MKNSVIYILGATVLVGGGYLFLKNKKEKDLSKLAELGGTTTGGTTTGGTTSGGTTSGGTTSGGTTSGGTTPSLSTVSDGVTPSDANLNLANATILVGQRANLVAKTKQYCGTYVFRSFGSGIPLNVNDEYNRCEGEKSIAKKQLPELDKKLATLGYKVDAIGQLVKI
jgi:LPXTG-motif cell wall-anchored protein